MLANTRPLRCPCELGPPKSAAAWSASRLAPAVQQLVLRVHRARLRRADTPNHRSSDRARRPRARRRPVPRPRRATVPRRRWFPVCRRHLTDQRSCPPQNRPTARMHDPQQCLRVGPTRVAQRHSKPLRDVNTSRDAPSNASQQQRRIGAHTWRAQRPWRWRLPGGCHRQPGIDVTLP